MPIPVPRSVSYTQLVLVDPHMVAEHQIELPDAGKVALAADGAGDLVLGDKCFQLLAAHAVGADGKPVLFGILLSLSLIHI